jgi:hypothetical protein
MRLHFDTLKDIQLALGDFEIGASAFNDGSFTLRFGYWAEIDEAVLNLRLPNHLMATKAMVDEDEFGKELVNYLISRR